MNEARSSAHGAADIRRAGQLSVYELFAAQAKRDPDALAIEQGSLRRSYGALDERVRRLAAALRSKGIRYGDRIALLSENRAEYIEIELAAAYLGAIVACQNWRLAAAELQHCLDLVSPALVIVSRRFAKMLSALDLHSVKSFIIEDRYEALIETAPTAPGTSRCRSGGRACHSLHQRHHRPAEGRVDQSPRRDRAHGAAAHGPARN